VRSRRALTLVEVMLAGGMMAFLLTVILGVLQLAVGFYRSSAAIGVAFQDVSQILDRVARELSHASRGNYVVAGENSSVVGFPMGSLSGQAMVFEPGAAGTTPWVRTWQRYVLYFARDGALWRNEFTSPPGGQWKPSQQTLSGWTSQPGAVLIARDTRLQVSSSSPWLYGTGSTYGAYVFVTVTWQNGDVSVATPRRLVRVY